MPVVGFHNSLLPQVKFLTLIHGCTIKLSAGRCLQGHSVCRGAEECFITVLVAIQPQLINLSSVTDQGIYASDHSFAGSDLGRSAFCTGTASHDM